LLTAAAKFAVPFALLSVTGAQIGRLLPGPVWIRTGSATLSTFFLQPEPPPLHSGRFREVALVLSALWLSGAAVMFGLWFRRLFAREHPAASATDTERETLDKMRKRIGLSRLVKLRCAPSSVEPGLAGVWRPTITIPQGLSARLGPTELEAILLHELAHAKRRDNRSGGFVRFLVCLFWFHPLLWWVERRLIAERELACDEIVIRCGVDPEKYAASILKVCRFHFSQVPAGACGMAGSDLKTRVEVIMSYRSRKPVSQPSKLLAGLPAVLMLVLPLAAGFMTRAVLKAQCTSANTAGGAAGSWPAVSCVNASLSYPEGTVIQYANGAQRLCVRGQQGRPMWVRTTNTLRERSRTVVSIPPTPQPTAFLCDAMPASSSDRCTCKERGEFEQGAIVNSSNGLLRCSKGGKWVAAGP